MEKYIFGSLSKDEEEPEGAVFGARPSANGLWSYRKLRLKSFREDLRQWLKGFGQDRKDEVYVTATKELGPQGHTGKVYKLVAAQ